MPDWYEDEKFSGDIEDYDDDDYDYDYDHTYLQDSTDYSTNFNAGTSNCEKTVHETSLLESDFISRNPLIDNNFVAIKNSVVKCVPLVEVNPPITDLADKKTVHETSLPESDFISRNPLIGNNFVAIKNSVVKCVPLVEVNPPIADLADKLLLLDINSLS